MAALGTQTSNSRSFLKALAYLYTQVSELDSLTPISCSASLGSAKHTPGVCVWRVAVANDKQNTPMHNREGVISRCVVT